VSEGASAKPGDGGGTINPQRGSQTAGRGGHGGGCSEILISRKRGKRVSVVNRVPEMESPHGPGLLVSHGDGKGEG